MLLWPLVIYTLGVLFNVGVMLLGSWVLGERHVEHSTNEPYESGVLPVGSARRRYPAQFYLIAMFFVVFDLEAVFIFSWAISLRQTGWFGYVEMLIFSLLLLLALAYLWRSGGLDWGKRAVQRMSTRDSR